MTYRPQCPRCGAGAAVEMECTIDVVRPESCTECGNATWTDAEAAGICVDFWDKYDPTDDIEENY